MAKITLKGIVKSVSAIQNVGKDGATRKQSIILFVPGYRDDFGDQRGPDEQWSLDLFNKRIDEVSANSNLVDKKVECLVYVNSQKVDGKDGGEAMYFINANLGKIKLAEGSQPQPEKKAW